MSEAIEIVNAEPEVIELAVDFDSEVSARDAEAWAVGKRGGVDVSEDDPTYHNNSKYYSEFAESEAQEAIDTIRTAAEEIRDDSIVAINQAAEEARESIPADYTQLSDDVTELKSALDDLPYSIYHATQNTVDKYLDIDGNEVSVVGWSITDFLRINKSAIYYLESRVTSSVVYSCFYDINKTFISSFKTDKAGSNKLVAPDGAEYVRFSVQSADSDVFEYSSKLLIPDKDNAVTPNLLYNADLVKTFRDELITGSYYNASGDISTSAAWSRTPLYEVDTGDTVIMENAQGIYAVLYDEDKIFVRALTDNTLGTKTYTVESGIAHMGFNIVNANLSGYNCTINDTVLSALYNVPWLGINSERISIWKNKKYISHGDSITWQDGKAYIQGEHIGDIARGYQTVFSDAVELASYNNQGKSGWSMAVVNGNGAVNTVLAVSDYSIYDLCTIACGTNDFKLNVPLGTLGMIGDTTFDDSTFYGAYRKAVEYILTSSPTIRIVLMTPLQRDNSGYDVNYTNSVGHKLIDYVNAVKAIGEMYGLPVCDMYSNSGFTKKTLSTYTMDGLHPNDIGYERMGGYLTGFLNAVGN